MSGENLPLLHKYVFKPGDDMQLQLSKLRYRLCVREVSDSIQARQAGVDLSAVEDYIVEDTMAAVQAQPAFAEPRGHHDNGLHVDDDVTQSPELSSPEGDESLLMPPGKGGIPADDSGISMDDSAYSMNTSQYTNSSLMGQHDNEEEEEEEVEDDDEDEDERDDDYTINGYHHDDDSEQEEEGGQLPGNSMVVDEQDTPIAAPLEGAVIEVEEDEIVATFKPSEKAPRRWEVERESSSESGDVMVVTETEAQSPDGRTDGDTDGQVVEGECVEVEEEPVEAVVAKKRDSGSDLDTSLESQPEPEPEPIPEIERVDFIPGSLAVDNVRDALHILKTRYRLSDSSVKRYIITSPSTNPNTDSDEPIAHSSQQHTGSRWNLLDMVREPNEAMPWWSKTREPEPVVVVKDDLIDMNDNIVTKELEIKDLLEKVLEEERQRLAEEEKTKEAEAKPSPSRVPLAAPVEEQIVPVETIPENQAPAPAPAPTDDGTEEDPKKKKGNIFQRMIRALRKRLGHRSRA